jgi:hypothetical protein
LLIGIPPLKVEAITDLEGVDLLAFVVADIVASTGSYDQTDDEGEDDCQCVVHDYLLLYLSRPKLDTHMKTSFPDRAARLEKILSNTKRTIKLPLFHEAEIPKTLFWALQEDCINYLITSLRAANPSNLYVSRPDVLQHYSEDILKLPNMTPNGLVLPKQDNYLAYNQLHKTVCDIFRQFSVCKHVDTIHAPINIRVINGKPSAADSRPRASCKLHSDIWAGEFTNTVMVFLTALGDVFNNGIEFYEPPQRFHTEFCKPLNDYLEGACLEAESERYDASLQDGFAYFTDPFLLHRTIKKSPSLRLSIDFRFVPYGKCETDIEVNTERHKNYISLDEWSKIGRTSLLYTGVTIAESKAENIGPKNAYAAEYALRRVDAD